MFKSIFYPFELIAEKKEEKKFVVGGVDIPIIIITLHYVELS